MADHLKAYRDGCTLRHTVEVRIKQRTGRLTPWQAGRVQTLLRLEESSRALELEIRLKGADMSTSDIRANRESVVRWSLQRDNILAELLGSDATSGSDDDVWADLDQATQEWNEGACEPQHSPSAPNATRANVEPQDADS